MSREVVLALAERALLQALSSVVAEPFECLKPLKKRLESALVGLRDSLDKEFVKCVSASVCCAHPLSIVCTFVCFSLAHPACFFA